MVLSNHSFLGFKRIDLTDDTEVAAAGENIQSLQPPKGQIYQIIDIEMKIPAIGGANGTHYMQIRMSNYNTFNLAQLTGTDGAQMAIYYLGFDGSSELPSNYPVQLDWLKKTYCNNSDYINFRYFNNSDTAQAGTRELQVYVLVYKDEL